MLTEEQITEQVPAAVIKGLAKTYWRGATEGTFLSSGESPYLNAVVQAAIDVIESVTGESADEDTVDPMLDAIAMDHEDEFREDRPLFAWERD